MTADAKKNVAAWVGLGLGMAVHLVVVVAFLASMHSSLTHLAKDFGDFKTAMNEVFIGQFQAHLRDPQLHHARAGLTTRELAELDRRVSAIERRLESKP